MDHALIHNLQVLADIPPHGDIRIVSHDAAPWPPEPDSLPDDMTLNSHSLEEDTRWSWLRPALRLLTGDTSHAIVNFLMLMTRALELYKGQPHVAPYVGPAVSGLVRLQDTTYRDCKFVKLALITCRCAWRQYEI